VLLLIIILVGGAVWLYFINRNVGGEEAVIAQETNARTAGAKSSQPNTENKVASAAPTNAAQTNAAQTNAAPSNKEDEFASILKELAGTEESNKAGGGAPGAGKEQSGAAVTTAAPAEQTQAAPVEQAQVAPPPKAAKELTKELAILGEQTRRAEQAAKQLNKATGQLLEQEKETTALMSKAETATKENLNSLNAEAAAEGRGENALVATPPPPPPPPAEKTPANKPEAQEKPGAYQEAFPKTVTVQSGDSLSAIAKRVYGDVNKWRLIYKANQDQLKDPNALLAGMKLTIPAPQE
jgi:LysM repeat protein